VGVDVPVSPGAGLCGANFGFLAEHDEQLVRLAALSERYFADDPNTSLIKLRQFSELLAQQVAARYGLLTITDEPQADLLRRLKLDAGLPRDVLDIFHHLRKTGNAEATEVALPPFQEQRRIVAKVDSLFAKTRRTREELGHIPRLVELYNQAILDRAFCDFKERDRLINLIIPERGIPYGIVQTGDPTPQGVPTVGGDIKGFCVNRSQLKLGRALINAQP
jgi:hypothetical protein